MHPQVLLAVKAALACGVAWALALLIPGPAAEYPYYAPLGALMAMYPTVAGTTVQGLQAIVGLGVGVGLAYIGILIGDVGAFTVAFVVGAGMLVSGALPRLGGGSHWIPAAGLFVLVVGGSDIADYSLGYFIQMVVGVLIGMIVSTLIFPPLYAGDGVLRMTGLRRSVAHQLQNMGQALAEKWAPDDIRWAASEKQLAQAARGVREAVRYGEESRKGNIRSGFHRGDPKRDYEHVRALERVTFHVENITDMLNDAICGTADQDAIPEAMSVPLQEAFAAIAEVLYSWTINDDDDKALATARTAMRRVSETGYRSLSSKAPYGAASAIAMSLQQILKAVTPLLKTAGKTTPEKSHLVNRPS
ncbi:FUSC family protein [Arthrobacter sp. H14]|uniref:FUSC family protein n=1 Tax=Arthrobacter sp. H14 TaxID=1312959 RepID=UPI0004AD75BE|nr:FUSC family protein [Arthrobacter sp. H14]